MNQLPKLVVVGGTTASGKSDLGVELAKAFDGEVVSADSRQVFRGLDLGSGKITPEETQGIPHHLIDVCDPGDFFSMHDFQRLAYRAIDDIIARGRLPILVGGTGLYIASVTEGYVMSDCMPDLAYRDDLEKLTTPQLYEMLLEKAPDIQVDAKNRNRVMRILEKMHDGDDHLPHNQPRYNCLKLGVAYPRPVLKERIDILGHTLCHAVCEEAQCLLSLGGDLIAGCVPHRLHLNQMGIQQLIQNLLECKIVCISFIEKKFGHLCVRQRKVYFFQHIKCHQLV